MKWFRREAEPRPEWARPLGSEYELFRTAVDEHLHGRDAAYDWSVADGTVTIRRGHLSHVASLENLVRLYRTAGHLERPILIREFFEPVFELEPDIEDWATARALMRVGLRSPAYLEASKGDGMDFHVEQHQLADELMAVLFLERSKSWSLCTTEMLAEWGAEPTDAWSAALANLQDDPVIKDETTMVHGSVPVRAIFGATAFSAARLLALPDYVEVNDSRGAIVGVPSGSELLAHAITSSTYEVAGNFLIKAVSELYLAEEIDALSPHLYWWRPSGLQPLTTISGTQLTWRPPPEFTEMVSGLPELSGQ